MSSWEKIFSNQTLKTGRDIYEQGMIRDEIGITNDSFILTVDGSKRYRVSIVIPTPSRLQVSCTCPVAMDGFRCKHMAASMMKLDEMFENWLSGTRNLVRKKALTETTVPVVESKGIEEAQKQKWQKHDSYLLPYHSINFSNIFSDKYRVTPTILEKGIRLVKEGKAVVTSATSFVLPDSCKRVFNVTVEVSEPSQKVTATMSCDQDQMIMITCNSDRCKRYPDLDPYDGNVLCVHQVAAMQLLRKELEVIGDIDQTDSLGQKVINQYTKLADEDNPGNLSGGQLFRLIPKLHFVRGFLYVDFRCGSEKDYAVRNLPILVKAYEEKKTFQLWKTNIINFRIDRLDKTSEQLMQIIRKAVKNYEMGSFFICASFPGANENSLYLYGSLMDDFFDLYLNKQLSYNEKERTLVDGIPRIHLDVKPKYDQSGRFKSVSVSGSMPEKICGLNYWYFERGVRLVRVSKEWLAKSIPLFNAREYDNTVYFEIGRQRLGEFYRKLLPAMGEVAQIDDYAYDAVKPFIPPEGKTVFYLDCDQDYLMCDARIQYGEYEADLMNRDEHRGFFRDLYSEQNTFDTVRKWFTEYDPNTRISRRKRKDDETYAFLRDGLSELQLLGEVQASAEFRKLRLRRGFQPKVGVEVVGNLLEVTLLTVDFSHEEMAEILRSYQKKKRFHILKNGDFLDLSDTENTLFNFLNSTDISISDFVNGKMHLPAYRMLYLNEMLRTHDEIFSTREESFFRLVEQFDEKQQTSYEIPASLTEIMRPYQVTGFQWMERIMSCGFCGILADDMGLGKTLQVIAVLLSDKEHNRNEGKPSLITCPASLVYNWEREFNRFAPMLRIRLVVGTAPVREEIIRDAENWDVLITSYDLMKRDIDKYNGIRFWLHVLDEAQYIKNQLSHAAKSAKVVDAERRMALTGTPIENRLSELWSIFDFLMPGFLYSYTKFHDEIEYPAVKLHDEEAMERLRKMVSPFVMRRLKKDVLKDLPEKTEETRFITLTEDQQKLYNAMAEHIRHMLMEENDPEEKKRFKILAELTRLRQVCCDPHLLYENYTGESSKRIELIELLREVIDAGHKVLVFSQFTSMMELIEEDLRQEDILFYHLSGDTPKQERIRLADAFNSDETPVFMISLKAGGTGLNLIGADVVIHFEPWWNVAVMNQATDRAHRIGQVHPVTVFNLIAKNTIEERVQLLQEAKRELAEGILNGETGLFNRLTKEELLDLLYVSGDSMIPETEQF